MMKLLLKLRRSIKIFYSKNTVWIRAVLKFILALAVFQVIQLQFGFERTIRDSLIMVVLALVSAFVSTNTISVLAGIFVIANFSSMSLEAFGIGSVIVLMVGLLYFGLGPKESCSLLLMPITLSLHLPCLIPVVVGLVGKPSAAWGIAVGTILYYVVEIVTGSSYMAVSGEGMDEILRHITGVLDELAHAQDIVLMVVILLIVFAVVSILRRMSVDYAWYLAIGAGIFSYLLLTVITIVSLGSKESFIGTISSAVITIFAALLTQIFIFNVDYRRTERLQFEDDEYYYYVKAVPKLGRGKNPMQSRDEILMQEEEQEERFAGQTNLVQQRPEIRRQAISPIQQQRPEIRRQAAASPVQQQRPEIRRQAAASPAQQQRPEIRRQAAASSVQQQRPEIRRDPANPVQRQESEFNRKEEIQMQQKVSEIRRREAVPVNQIEQENGWQQDVPVWQEKEKGYEETMMQRNEAEEEMTEEEIREQHRQEWLRIRTEQGGSRYDRRKGG